MKAWGIAFVRGNDLGDGCHPVHRLIAYVPDQPESSVRLEHPVDLGQSRFSREPVKSLSACQRLSRSGSERDRLGRSLQDPDVRQIMGKLGSHGLDRFDGNDIDVH
ncbi:hypothetical protein D3C87_1576650 [compost metagenome]